MPDGQKRATLRIEGRTFDVHLVDASATGVALACPLQVALDIDDCCELHTASGDSFIRIVRKEVFSDGILLGALRTDDTPEPGGGWIKHLRELMSLPGRANLGPRLAVVATLAILLFGSAFSGWHFYSLKNRLPVATGAPLGSVGATGQSAGDLQAAIRQVESSLPELTSAGADGDQRAQRIFGQQKQLLLPETSRRLRLTPSQESRIQRAVEVAEAAAADMSSHEFWEAIRRSEQAILSILSPTQIKVWRQQDGT